MQSWWACADFCFENIYAWLLNRLLFLAPPAGDPLSYIVTLADSKFFSQPLVDLVEVFWESSKLCITLLPHELRLPRLPQLWFAQNLWKP